MKLKRITLNETKDLIKDDALLKEIEKGKFEPLKITRKISTQKTDPLIQFEISFGKCKRLGVFKK